jgi:hypothetical protein
MLVSILYMDYVSKYRICGIALHYGDLWIWSLLKLNINYAHHINIYYNVT